MSTAAAPARTNGAPAAPRRKGPPPPVVADRWTALAAREILALLRTATA